jgi:hypothetical protein
MKIGNAEPWLQRASILVMVVMGVYIAVDSRNDLLENRKCLGDSLPAPAKCECHEHQRAEKASADGEPQAFSSLPLEDPWLERNIGNMIKFLLKRGFVVNRPEPDGDGDYHLPASHEKTNATDTPVSNYTLVNQTECMKLLPRVISASRFLSSQQGYYEDPRDANRTQNPTPPLPPHLRPSFLLVIGIPCTYDSTRMRMALRGSWMTYANVYHSKYNPEGTILVMFILGREEHATQEAVRESKHHDDVWFAEGVSDGSVTHKTLAFFAYASRNINFTYASKADPDIFIRTEKESRLSLLILYFTCLVIAKPSLDTIRDFFFFKSLVCSFLYRLRARS